MIRLPTPADRDAFLAMARGSRKLHGSWVRPASDAKEFADYLKRIDGERFVAFLVCLRDGGGIVGVVNVSDIIRGRLQSAFLGYYANAAYCGQGLMTEGLRLVVAHAFTQLKLHRVEANIQPANLPSIALAQRCGFRREGFSPRYLKIAGRWRDHERWAMTLEDWKASRRLRFATAPPLPPNRQAKKRKALN